MRWARPAESPGTCARPRSADGQPVRELTVVRQQDQAGRVRVEPADGVYRRRPSGTRPVTARREPGSRAVETTSSGLFTAQTSRWPHGLLVHGHTAAPADVTSRVGDDLAGDRHVPRGDIASALRRDATPQ